MPTPSTHPRRRPASPALTPSLLESFAALSLRKGSTFHSPTLNKTALWNPLDSATSSPSMPLRSSTCPKDLEDLLIGAGERRALRFLAKVDEAIERHSSLDLKNFLNEPDTLPNPSFLLDSTSLDGSSEQKVSARRDSHQGHDHASDSGLGSSIADPDEIRSVKDEAGELGMTSSHNTHNNIDAHTYHPDLHTVPAELRQATKHLLSDHAAGQIQKHVVSPILREQALKAFHPLVASVPRRISTQQIVTLRDLEKKLIFLAPVSTTSGDLKDLAVTHSICFQDYSCSPAAYLQFCETAIHCLHATVDNVHESDQHAPTDRPYTNHYFSDLVEQIRRYAAILAATRDREAKGEAADKMDISKYVALKDLVLSCHNTDTNNLCRDEKLELYGGMLQNGKPAQLVRQKKSGTIISMETGEVLTPSKPDAVMTPKRAMSSEVDDDGVRRSMARRKKGALPVTYTCSQGACDRIFPRRCDLTKHMKTHERAWKCRKDRDCEYTVKGWPTEKERDRHENDKHNPDAVKYNCEFCDYFSTRPENTKAHQEKKHSWDYVRQKTIKGSKASKARAKAPVKRASRPAPSTSSTPFSVEQSPITHSHPSTSVSPPTMITPYTADEVSPYDSPMLDVPTDFRPEFGNHFSFDFSNMGMSMPFSTDSLAPMPTPSLMGDRRASNGSSTMNTTPIGDTSFEDAMIPPTPEDLDFTNSLFNGYIFQQPQDNVFLGASASNTTATFVQPTISPHFRLGNLEDPTLSVPQLYSQMDQAFCSEGAMNDDFQLFDTTAGSCSDPLFQDQTFGSLGSQFQDPQSSSSNADADAFGSYGQYFPELNSGQAQ